MIAEIYKNGIEGLYRLAEKKSPTNQFIQKEIELKMHLSGLHNIDCINFYEAINSYKENSINSHELLDAWIDKMNNTFQAILLKI